MAGPDLPEHLDTALSRHHDIEQNQIEFLLSDEIEGRKTAFGLYNDTSAPGKPPAEQGAIFFDVIDHQQAKGLGWVCLHHKNTATDEVRHHPKRQKLINDANRLRLFNHLNWRIERSPCVRPRRSRRANAPSDHRSALSATKQRISIGC